MAKDLPYFKFYVSEWNDGTITLEDYHTQGLFINICSFYWSRECNVTIQQLYKRFKEVEIIDNLISLEIIKLDNDNVVIEFLDDYLEEKTVKSIKAKKAANARWNKEEKKPIPKKKAVAKFNFKQELLNLGANKQLVDDWLVVRKNKKASNTQTAFNSFKKQLEKSCKTIDFVLNFCVSNSWSGFNSSWLEKEKAKTNNNITF